MESCTGSSWSCAIMLGLDTAIKAYFLLVIIFYRLISGQVRKQTPWRSYLAIDF